MRDYDDSDDLDLPPHWWRVPRVGEAAPEPSWAPVDPELVDPAFVCICLVCQRRFKSDHHRADICWECDQVPDPEAKMPWDQWPVIRWSFRNGAG